MQPKEIVLIVMFDELKQALGLHPDCQIMDIRNCFEQRNTCVMKISLPQGDVFPEGMLLPSYDRDSKALPGLFVETE